MHESERRKLELKRELLAYLRSDEECHPLPVILSRIRSSKLHCYLRQICNREAIAKMRNLKLLRDVENLEINMDEYCPDLASLQLQKDDFLNKVSTFIKDGKKAEQRFGRSKVKPVHRQSGDHSFCHLTKDYQQPPVVNVIGCQTSRGSNAETGTTSVHSHQAFCHSPNSSMHSHKRLPSGLLKDFRVGGEDAASNRTHLSDDISGSNDSPNGSNLSDKHERTLAGLPSVRAFVGVAGNVPFGSNDEQERPPLVTLKSLERNSSPSSSHHSPMRLNNHPVEQSDSRDIGCLTQQLDARRGPGDLMPKNTFGKDCQDAPGQCESICLLSSDAQLPESSATDLSITLTQSELEDDYPEGVATERNHSTNGTGSRNLNSPEWSPCTDGSEQTPQINCRSTSPKETFERLSQQGLFSLLDSIEGRLEGAQTTVYGDVSVDEKQCNRIISICNSGTDLNNEDLEACGAVVLHELQRLSWSTAKGCLLTQELVRVHHSSTDPDVISTSLPPDVAQLWNRWFRHALLLRERHVLSTELLVEHFTPLLLERHATYSHQAKVLLRTLLSQSSEKGHSAEDESDFSSSCCSPLSNTGGAMSARPLRKQTIRELQSTKEDSLDESPVESVPIRETKAYQSLKKSAMQERPQSSEEEIENEDEEEKEDTDALSGINHDCKVDLGRAKRSSHQDPYLRKEKTYSKVYSVLHSKAFWGESDDSNSDIEAALRPQSFNVNDDTDDFYD